jgi:hypothetical protein
MIHYIRPKLHPVDGKMSPTALKNNIPMKMSRAVQIYHQLMQQSQTPTRPAYLTE